MKDSRQGAIALIGEDRDIWDDPDKLDLLVLMSRKQDSIVSELLSDKFIHWFHQNVMYPLVRTSIP